MSKIGRITAAEARAIAGATLKGPFQRIVEQVALETGVAERLILGSGRTAEIVQARHRAMWMARKEGIKVAVIARAMGKDNSTIAYGVSREEARRRGAAPARQSTGPISYSITAERGMVVTIDGQQVCIVTPDRLPWLAAQVADAAHRVAR